MDDASWSVSGVLSQDLMSELAGEFSQFKANICWQQRRVVLC